MRKTFYPVKLFVLFALIVFALSTFAATALTAPTHQAVFVIGQNSYTADGQEKTMDAAAFIENDRTYVPVRYLAYALGVAEKDVGWDGSTNTVTLKLGGITLKMVIGSKILYVNGQPKQMDVAPLIVLGRTYLPARWVAEAFGYEIGWNETVKAVLIGPKGDLPALPIPPKEVTCYSYGRAAVVEIPPGAPVRPAVILGQDQLGKTESLASMAERTGAVAAINGTYFNAYADKPGEPHGTPYGTIIKDGKPLLVCYDRAIAGITAEGRVKIAILRNLIEKKEGIFLVDENDVEHDWSDVVAAVQAGPRLVKNGEVAVNFKAEYFDEDKITTIAAARSAIGVKPDGSILLVTAPGMTIYQLAELMKELGASDAMNLDGGASSGLWCNGRYLTEPGREISNALAFLPR